MLKIILIAIGATFILVTNQFWWEIGGCVLIAGGGIYRKKKKVFRRFG